MKAFGNNVKRIIIYFTYSLCCLTTLRAQPNETLDFINHNAIACKHNDSSLTRLSEAALKFRLLMFGEIHGSTNTSEFVSELIRSLQGKMNIRLFIELPDSLLQSILSAKNSSFSGIKTNSYNCAWLNLIQQYKHTVSIHGFVPDGEISPAYDSLMFVKLKSMLDTNAINILVCGNLHNKLTVAQQKKYMGYYLYNDANPKVKPNQILSCDHVYKSGEYHILQNGNPVIKPASNTAKVFGNTSMPCYFIVLPVINYGYNAFFYDEIMRPSSFRCDE